MDGWGKKSFPTRIFIGNSFLDAGVGFRSVQFAHFQPKNVQKVEGYNTKKLRRSQLLPNPTLEVPITLADASGHDALASAQVMGTSNIGLESK